MVKGVIVTKENSHTSFLNVKHFYKLRGAYYSLTRMEVRKGVISGELQLSNFRVCRTTVREPK